MKLKFIKRIVTIVIALSLIMVNLNLGKSYIYANDLQVTDDLDSKTQKEELNIEEVPCIMDYETAIKNKHVKREKERENGLNEVVFQNQDGSYTLYVYEQNVKFIDDNGNIKDIDIGIETIENAEKKGYTYTNGANDVNVDFPDLIKDDMMVNYMNPIVLDMYLD